MARRHNPFLSGYATYDTSDGFGNPKEWRKAFKARMTGQEAKAILKEQSDTPWAILGVKQGASKTEIKAAFRRLIKIWHPDRNPHNIVNAERMSKIIIAAYTTLINQ